MSTTNIYDPTVTDTQQKRGAQQPSYMQQAYEGVSSVATSAGNAISVGGNQTQNYPSSQYQPRNQQPQLGGVGDLGTDGEMDVARLPEERANPDPLAQSGTTTSNPTYSDLTGAATYPPTDAGAGQGYTRGTGTSPSAQNYPGSTSNTDNYGKSWDNSGGTAISGTAADVTQPGHSGGMTGSNHDNDHGLGMPHKSEYDNRRGRDESADVGTGAGTQGDIYDQQRPNAGRLEDDSNVGEQGRSDLTGVTSQQPISQDTTLRNRRGSQEDDSDDSTGKTGPTKMDKIKGRVDIAVGKLIRDPERVQQGKSLKATGQRVDIQEEIEDGKLDNLLTSQEE